MMLSPSPEMSNVVATSHMWLLSTSNIMTSATEKMHLNFLILFQKLIFDIVIRKKCVWNNLGMQIYFSNVKILKSKYKASTSNKNNHLNWHLFCLSIYQILKSLVWNKECKNLINNCILITCENILDIMGSIVHY